MTRLCASRYSRCVLDDDDHPLLHEGLANMSGIDAMTAIRSKFPDARFIILTTFAGDGRFNVHSKLEHALMC